VALGRAHSGDGLFYNVDTHHHSAASPIGSVIDDPMPAAAVVPDVVQPE
jgi:hypothetical protein